MTHAAKRKPRRLSLRTIFATYKPCDIRHWRHDWPGVEPTTISMFILVSARGKPPQRIAAEYLAHVAQWRAHRFVYRYWAKHRAFPAWAQRMIADAREARRARLIAWDAAMQPKWAARRAATQRLTSAVRVCVARFEPQLAI